MSGKGVKNRRRFWQHVNKHKDNKGEGFERYTLKELTKELHYAKANWGKINKIIGYRSSKPVRALDTLLPILEQEIAFRIILDEK